MKISKIKVTIQNKKMFGIKNGFKIFFILIFKL